MLWKEFNFLHVSLIKKLFTLILTSIFQYYAHFYMVFWVKLPFILEISPKTALISQLIYFYFLHSPWKKSVHRYFPFFGHFRTPITNESELNGKPLNLKQINQLSPNCVRFLVRQNN